MQNNLAIFYCGTNGAGKSTLRSFNQDRVQVVIDSDHIAMEINPQNPRLADIEAGRKAVELFKYALKNQVSFSMESTLAGKSILHRMQQAKSKGFYVRLNYVGVNSVSINLDRVNARVRKGGHFIDEATIHKRYEISRQNLILALPFCDEAFIYDNSAEMPILIFHLSKSKRITQFEKVLPSWCENLLAELLQLDFNLV
ncbi:zeta toxin family protein [Avibacterium paragallinarum]|uniref:Zeta toxin family protein n=1 Tax=Avibacterium paragallinarum TaxID=728 RepID=A0AAE5WIA6_AVIPA|nr:zeta toxin family protein [Avibacterium paragallinarum]MEE3608324.1 zeta toxin family protein [Avibacterium paragallinarum]MEE3621374.1 zeta toxin family protein [Avibacterium paragallinarum]MEE3668054.1 zeta toxin family protein [Avibacterium paragallinarum]MEE3681167.1 zeta toxin family protein [Avibacterium paragallinarum]MEE4386361.1 zeta toxin family protein [Avibacterium paragallinarum]